VEETKQILMFVPTEGECLVELFTQCELELRALEYWLDRLCVKYALILSVDNISKSWVVDSGASFHATPHRTHFYIMFKVILDRFIWVMMHHAKLLEWEG
jgi:hypothetical protein